jgi:hypothetical protein
VTVAELVRDLRAKRVAARSYLERSDTLWEIARDEREAGRDPRPIEYLAARAMRAARAEVTLPELLP